MSNTMRISPEELAYWYFRLNGCFTITNFVVHPDKGRRQRTDVDIFAVRFPFRSELLLRPMEDDIPFKADDPLIKVVLAEVKRVTCNLNGPWTDRSRGNMERAIKAAGPFPIGRVEEAAAAIYRHGHYILENCSMTMFCVGNSKNLEIQRRYPAVPQLTFIDILTFMFKRFKDYYGEKCDHPQWSQCGKYLFRAAKTSASVESFLESVIVGIDTRHPTRACSRPAELAADA